MNPEQDVVTLETLALWCPYCKDVANPVRSGVDAAILNCPTCGMSIGHAEWRVVGGGRINA